METRNKTNIAVPDMKSAATAGSADTGVDSDSATTYASRKLTFTENVILTMKILGGAVLIMAGLWGINQWTSAR